MLKYFLKISLRFLFTLFLNIPSKLAAKSSFSYGFLEFLLNFTKFPSKSCQIFQQYLYTLFLNFCYFLAIFRNEITTILTPSTSKGGGHVFRFEGP